MPETAVQTRLWTRKEYERLIAGGIFQPEERLELIEGKIVQKGSQGSAHATAVTLVEHALRKVFGPNDILRIQMPLALDPDSEPEPDVAVIQGSPRDYRDENPHHAEFVIEVADTTLAYDRSRKAAVYARAGIQEYWILNLIDRQLEVYRQPRSEHSGMAAYQESRILSDSESLSLFRFPQETIQVADLLP